MIIVGKSVPRKDAPDKVRGTIKYTTDYAAPDCFMEGLSRAPIPMPKSNP
jgi:CO/xanthine dehydrogenase Mo-binding subunit